MPSPETTPEQSDGERPSAVKLAGCARLGLDPRLFIDGVFSDRAWKELLDAK